MSNSILILEKELAHKCIGTVKFEYPAVCDICHIEYLCLTFDTSGDEYGSISVCEACLYNAIETGKSATIKRNPLSPLLVIESGQS